MAAFKKLLTMLKRKPKTAEQVQHEVEALDAQRNFELSTTQYPHR